MFFVLKGREQDFSVWGGLAMAAAFLEESAPSWNSCWVDAVGQGTEASPVTCRASAQLPPDDAPTTSPDSVRRPPRPPPGEVVSASGATTRLHTGVGNMGSHQSPGPPLLSPSLSVVPRVDQDNPRVQEVLDVARGEGRTVGPTDRCDLCIEALDRRSGLASSWSRAVAAVRLRCSEDRTRSERSRDDVGRGPPAQRPDA